MAIKSLQKKLDHAHKKVGKELGYAYKVYRAINNVDVLSDANYIGTANTWTTLNDEASRDMEFQIPTWNTYTDATIVQQGDFLYSEEENRTLMVLIRKPMEPLLAIEVNDRCTITKVGYADTGNGYGPVDGIVVAKNLPCFVNFGNRELLGRYSIPGRKTLAEAGVKTANITTSLPFDVEVMGYTIEDDSGFRGSIIKYSYSSYNSSLQITATEYGATPD